MTRREYDRTNAELAVIPGGEERVLLATGRYVGEGFDDARLDTLFLTLPVSWHGTVAQYVGRLHRLYQGKRDVYVYDYADLEAAMLSRMFDRRCKGYEAVGYAIQLPASAGARLAGGSHIARRFRVEGTIRRQRPAPRSRRRGSPARELVRSSSECNS